MLTKYKDVRPRKSVKSPLKNVFMSAAYSEFFSGRVHQILLHFQAYSFSDRILLKHIETRKGSGDMLPRKIFKNSHTVVTLFVLFEPFLGKFCKNFLPLNLSVSPNVMHFVRAFSIMRVGGIRLDVIKKVQNYGKIVFIKNMFENGWWRDAFAPARTNNNVSSLRQPAGLASAMWSKLCHSYNKSLVSLATRSQSRLNSFQTVKTLFCIAFFLYCFCVFWAACADTVPALSPAFSRANGLGREVF